MVSCHLKINQNSSSPRIQALYLCCVSSFNRKEVPEKLPPREMFMGGWLGVFNKFVSASLSLILRHHVFENWKRAEDAWKCSTKIETISMHKEGSKFRQHTNIIFPAKSNEIYYTTQKNLPIPRFEASHP